MKLKFKIIGAIILSTLYSCADKDVKSLTDNELDSEIEVVSKELISLTSDLSCESDNQCGVYKYGHKSCGGPMEYKLYSAKNTNESLLFQLSDRYYDLTKEFNSRNQIASDCAFISPPEVMCNGVCQIK